MLMALVQPANSISELPSMTPPNVSVGRIHAAVGSHTKKTAVSKVNKVSKNTVKTAAKTAAKSAKLQAKKPVVKSSSKKIARVNRKMRAAVRTVATAKPMAAAQRARILSNFASGIASSVSPEDMVRAGAFKSYALRGGIFRRRSEIKALVVHSTETATPATAKQIVRSWNNSGRNHAGTQYIIDRDGVIYQTAHPLWGTFHVDSRITREGVKNDNSIGIEIVRTGNQTYTAGQLSSVARLTAYLTERYSIAQVFGHGQVQPADRTDPVGFNWTSFNRNVGILKANQIAARKVPVINQVAVGKTPAEKAPKNNS